MAGRWAEGFESHKVSTQQARKYATLTGSMSQVAGRTFGNAGAPSSSGAIMVTPSMGSNDTWIIGFGCFVASHSTTLNSSAQGMYFESGVNEQFHIELITTNGVGFRVALYRGATLLDETGDFPFSVWQYFELKVFINTATGTFELRRNGVLEFSGTGANTALNGNTGADIFAFRWTTDQSTRLRLDDIYINDGSGAKNNDFLGPRIVEMVEVTANGDTNQWDNDNTGVPDANNFDQVNDLGTAAPDETGAGGTISSDTNAEVNLFVMSDLQQITGNIDFVFLGIQCAMAAAGSRTLKFKFRHNSTTNADGASFVVNSTVYDEFIQVWDDNPVTAVAWDVTDIDAAQFGLEVVS